GFVAARHLANRGCEVRLFTGPDLGEPQGDAGVNREIVRRMGLPVHPLKSPPRQPWPVDLAIDAILGTGIQGEVRGGAALLLEALRRSGAPILALDLPSGLE